MTLLMTMILVLLVSKHYFADYPLQTPYMLRKSNPEGWIFPLLAHAAVHGAFTLAILFIFVSPPIAFLLALFDFSAHALIDYVKAQHLRYPMGSRNFWNALGLDQWAHQLTYILVALAAIFDMATN